MRGLRQRRLASSTAGQTQRHSEGDHAHLVPPLLLLSAPLKLGSQGSGQGCTVLLQLLPQLLQLHPLPAGQQESGKVVVRAVGQARGHCEEDSPGWHLAACWPSRSFSSATSV